MCGDCCELSCLCWPRKALCCLLFKLFSALLIITYLSLLWFFYFTSYIVVVFNRNSFSRISFFGFESVLLSLFLFFVTIFFVWFLVSICLCFFG